MGFGVGILRYCPACGREAERGYTDDEILCGCCQRPWEACPCTPLHTLYKPCAALVSRREGHVG